MSRSLVHQVIFLIFFVFSSLAVSFAPVADTALAKTNEHDFRTIPGITAEEIAAIEALQKKGPLQYGALYSTEAFYREDGSLGGFASLYCDWMTQLFGIRFEPKIYDRDELLTKLNAGEVDFTGELTPTAERKNQYLMTRPILERPIREFRLRGSEPFSVIIKTRLPRYAFFEGSTNRDVVLSTLEYPVELNILKTPPEALEGLRSRQLDVVVAEGHSVALFCGDIIDQPVYPIAYSPVSLTTGRKELAPIISAFDKYLQSGAFPRLVALHDEGNKEYLRYSLVSQLSKEEKAYLLDRVKNRIPVPFIVEHDSYPSSFYNTQEQEWQGISIDVLAQISDLTGLEFSVINGTKDPWHILFDRLKRGEAAMATELIYSPDRKGKFLWADAPYAYDHYALLSSVKHPNVNVNRVLDSKVGLLRGSAYEEIFHRWFPEHRSTKAFDVAEKAFAALETGEIDLLMASQNMLLTVSNYAGNPGYKANIIFDQTYGASFGFHLSQEHLRTIVSKAQQMIDTEIITGQWTRKVFDYRNEVIRAQIPYLWGVSILLVCVLVLVLLLFSRNKMMQRKLESIVKERTAELVVQTDAANVASRAKGDFLSRMSHEIRTPLNAITGMAQIARRTALREGSATLSPINEVITASSHLLELLNSVLDMSKIEAGKFTLNSERFDMHTALSTVQSIIRERCAYKGIEFAENFAALKNISVMGDALRLKQVLVNLLGNAVKFTDSGGQISLLVEKQAESETGITLKFTAQDSGIGMNEEQLSRLFSPFEQAESNTASRFGGTGLGLAISQNLVKLMGGEIVVTSQPGAGSKFFFTLEFTKGESAGHGAVPVEAMRYNLANARILLCEDIEINRLIIQELLADTGVIVDEADNGMKGVHLFESSPEGYYGMILMDIQMPIMDGYEATRQIRSLPRKDAQAIPIIALTANAYQEDVKKALDAGMNRHLAKPLEVDALMNTLREMLGAQQRK